MAPARLLCALALALACGAAAARAPWHGAPAQAPARSLRAYSALLAVEPAESPAAIAALATAGLAPLAAAGLAPSPLAAAGAAALQRRANYTSMAELPMSKAWICRGDGRFVGARPGPHGRTGEFNGGGAFRLDNATFVGAGTFVADVGVVTLSTANSSCSGNASFTTKDLRAQLVGNGQISGSGVFELPSGTFSGNGDFKGQSMHFSGGDATFEANPGVLIGKGSASGRRFTCYGEGTFQGELDGWAEMVSASGTFQGPMGTCGGPAAAAA